jgi:hypothetical protein
MKESENAHQAEPIEHAHGIYAKTKPQDRPVGLNCVEAVRIRRTMRRISRDGR